MVRASLEEELLKSRSKTRPIWESTAVIARPAIAMATSNSNRVNPRLFFPAFDVIFIARLTIRTFGRNFIGISLGPGAGVDKFLPPRIFGQFSAGQITPRRIPFRDFAKCGSRDQRLNS